MVSRRWNSMTLMIPWLYSTSRRLTFVIVRETSGQLGLLYWLPWNLVKTYKSTPGGLFLLFLTFLLPKVQQFYLTNTSVRNKRPYYFQLQFHFSDETDDYPEPYVNSRHSVPSLEQNTLFLWRCKLRIHRIDYLVIWALFHASKHCYILIWNILNSSTLTC